MNIHFPVWAGALALSLPLLTSAQSATPDPASSTLASPALRFVSTFADYKPWQETAPGDWRAANDALLKVPANGQAGHGSPAPTGRPASIPAAPAAKSSPGNPTVPNGHTDHGSHGVKQ